MVYPAMVTPFTDEGDVDMPGIVRLVAWFRSHGCKGVVVAGTTGEGPSLSAVERRDMLRQAIASADGLEVILGVATNAISEAHWLCDQAAKAGAARVLVAPPTFFREYGQKGIASWYSEILNRSPIPILVYNFPKRFGQKLDVETVALLGKHDQFAGLKDSSGELENLAAYKQALPEKELYCGDESLILKALELGWTGTISGAANTLCGWLVPILADFVDRHESAEAKFSLVENAIQLLRTAPRPYTDKVILHSLRVMSSIKLRPPLLPDPSDRVSTAKQAVVALVEGRRV